MTFYERVKELCEDRGISITALILDLGLSKSAATTWKMSEGLPRAGTIKKVADYFGLSVAELKAGIDEPIDYESVNTDEFNQPVWQHLLEKYEYNEKRAIRAYFDYEKASMRDAVSMNIDTVADNHGIIGHAHAPVTVINGAEYKLTEQENALLSIFSRLDVIKKAQLLAYAAELDK